MNSKDYDAITAFVEYVAGCHVNAQARSILRDAVETPKPDATFNPWAPGRCRFEFKSAECGYFGPHMKCDKTEAACRERGNVERFGGFTTGSIPTTRNCWDETAEWAYACGKVDGRREAESHRRQRELLERAAESLDHDFHFARCSMAAEIRAALGNKPRA